MARHRTTKQRNNTRRTTPRRKPVRSQHRLTKAPPSKFRVRLGHVEIVSGSELFERRIEGIKEGRKRALRRMGAPGRVISKKEIPQRPKVERQRLRKKDRVHKIKVLVRARKKGPGEKVGREVFFTKTLTLKGGRTKRQAREREAELLELVEDSSDDAEYELDILSFNVHYQTAA